MLHNSHESYDLFATSNQHQNCNILSFQFTLMGYMIEGGGSKTMAKTKDWLQNHPKDVHKLLKLLTNVIIDYLVMQAS